MHSTTTGVLTIKDPELQLYLGQIGTSNRKAGRPKSKTKTTVYKDVICAFDIETTRIKRIEQSIMYIWQFQLGDYCTVIGRTWEEFMELLSIMKDYAGDNEHYMIFIHNASYEFQFLAGIYNFAPEEVFCMEPRKILRFEMFGCFEFRCSYLQTNMSLDEFTHKYGVEYAKLHDFDYDKPRYPWTELTDDELAYCLNDVRGLVQAIKKEMEIDGDTLYSIPMTSTGYVRRDLRRAMRTYNKDTLARQLPSMEIYTMLYKAFRGGNTHANRYYSGEIIGGEDHPYKVYSFDRSSSYPDVQCNDIFPVGRWQFELPEFCTAKKIHQLMDVRGKALLMDLTFINISLRDPLWGCPYISSSKCEEVVPDPEHRTYDNGRIMASRMLRMVITDVDFRIIASEYKWDSMIVNTLASSTYGSLPGQIVEQIQKYYINKTELKGLKEQEIFYGKQKALLNAIYGCTVQNPIKATVLFKPSGGVEPDYQPDTSKSGAEILENANKKAFMSYAWGIWTTAWARYRLEEGIRIAHHPEEGCYFLYADTDSVKFFCTSPEAYRKTMNRWRRYNKVRIMRSKNSGSYATDKHGSTHYMGVFELDGEYTKFCTMGAKKYAYEEDGTLHLTVAGVNKKKGAVELAEHGGIEAFQEGFIFKDAGGTESIYNDYPAVDHVKIQGHELKITRNVVIRPSTYELGITAEYSYILEHPDIYNKVFDLI